MSLNVLNHTKILLGLFCMVYLFNTSSAQTQIKILDESSSMIVYKAHVTINNKLYIQGVNGIIKTSETFPLNIQCIINGYDTLNRIYNNPINEIIIYMRRKNNELNPVVITGQLSPSTIDLSVQKVKVIDRNKIDQMGAVNLKDVLSNELNIRMGQDAVLGSKIKMQGLGGSQVKILMDGIPLIGRLDGNIDLSQINLNNIERIEIIEGPMAVVFGTDAIAGVINLITKRNNKTLYEFSLNSFNDTKGNYNYDGGFSKKIKNSFFGITLGRYFFNGWDETEDVYKRQMLWKPKEQYFVNSFYQFPILKTQNKIVINCFREFLLSKGSPLVTPFDAKAIDDKFITFRGNISLQTDYTINKYSKINFLNSYNIYQRNRNEYVKNLVTGDEIISSNFENQDTSKFKLIQLRGNYIRQNKKQNYTSQFGYDINFDQAIGKRFGNSFSTINDYALFFNNEYKPNAKLDFKVGFRAALNSRYKAPIIPMVGVRYQIKENHIIRLSAGSGFRAPNLKELTFLFVDINHNIIGNNDLKAEHSKNFQLNYTYTKKSNGKFSYKIECNLFQNYIKDMISLALMNSGISLYQYININQFASRGLNGQLSLFNKNYQIKLGIAKTGLNNYIISKNKYQYFNELNAAVEIKIPRIKSSVSMYYKYNGVQQIYALDDNGKLNLAYSDAWHWLDFSINKKIPKYNLQMIIGAKNILNIKTIGNTLNSGIHSQGGTSPIGMGRLFFVTLKYNLSKLLNNENL